jgi:hypothetical protein
VTHYTTPASSTARSIHDYFFDLLLVQPLGEHVQLARGRAELALLELILTFPGDIVTTTANIFL